MVQYTIWYEDAVGDTKGCLTLTPNYYHHDRVEMQIPFKDMDPERFRLWKDETERFCRSHGWNLIEGYTTQRFGDMLLRTDDRIKWTEEYIQVGHNKKRKLIWTLDK